MSSYDQVGAVFSIRTFLTQNIKITGGIVAAMLILSGLTEVPSIQYGLRIFSIALAIGTILICFLCFLLWRFCEKW